MKSNKLSVAECPTKNSKEEDFEQIKAGMPVAPPGVDHASIVVRNQAFPDADVNVFTAPKFRVGIFEDYRSRSITKRDVSRDSPEKNKRKKLLDTRKSDLKNNFLLVSILKMVQH